MVGNPASVRQEGEFLGRKVGEGSCPNSQLGEPQDAFFAHLAILRSTSWLRALARAFDREARKVFAKIAKKTWATPYSEVRIFNGGNPSIESRLDSSQEEYAGCFCSCVSCFSGMDSVFSC